MGWGERLARLFGAAPKPAARKPAGKQPNPGIAGSPRAKLIAEALKVHRVQGDMVREVLSTAITDLEKGGVKTLRDPEALSRLMSLIQAQRALQRMMRGGLKRYLVLGGVRELLGGPPAASPPTSPDPGAKSKVVRR